MLQRNNVSENGASIKTVSFDTRKETNSKTTDNATDYHAHKTASKSLHCASNCKNAGADEKSAAAAD